MLDFGLLLELGLIHLLPQLEEEEQHNISLLWAGNLRSNNPVDAYYTERQIFEDEASPESLVALGLSFPRMRIREKRLLAYPRHKIELLRHSIDYCVEKGHESVAEIEKRNPGFFTDEIQSLLIKYGLNVMIPVDRFLRKSKLYNVHAIVAGEEEPRMKSILIHNFTKRKLHLVPCAIVHVVYANVLKQKNYKTRRNIGIRKLVRLAHQICMIKTVKRITPSVVSVVGLLRS
ncbi:hypothetical protein SPFM12_00122 [Salmonella phage SPFM12]|nr:hypothetical protein SPFM12_00122 [Salmonella phage SPFM12]